MRQAVEGAVDLGSLFQISPTAQALAAQQAESSDRQHYGVTKDSPPAAKVGLFRTLFRGREDIYPRRFESRRTGQAGYAPACANEWVRGICEKPRIKCSDCPNRRFLPVTDEVIGWHLLGRDGDGSAFVMGVYPMLLDESCFFLALDLTAETGSKIAKLFSNPAGNSMYLPHWSDHGRAMVAMSGCSSRIPFLPFLHASWDRTF
jgi:hypothetical protein